MIIDKLKNVLEEYYKSVFINDMINTGDTDIYVNPTSKELKEIMYDEEDSKRSARFISDASGRTTYVWRWDKAVHGTMRHVLKLHGETLIGGTVILIPSRGVVFDLGSISINKDNGLSNHQMEDIFFKTSLAKVLNMTPDNTKVSFFEYGGW